jgi:hypothetical protein
MALAPGLLRLNGPCGVVWETPVQWVVTPNYTPNYTPELHPRELILSFCELMVYSGQSRGRTGDLRIFSPSLYQLSYLSNTTHCSQGRGPDNGEKPCTWNECRHTPMSSFHSSGWARMNSSMRRMHSGS